MSLLDWLSDSGVFGSSMNSSGTPMAPGPGASVGEVNPMGDPTGQSMPLPTPAPAATAPMPPPQMMGNDVMHYPPGGDPMSGMGSGNNPGLPYAPGGDPMAGSGSGNDPGLPPGIQPPQPRPAGAALPPAAAPPGGAEAPPGVDVPGAVQSYQRAGGKFGYPDEGAGQQAQAKTFLGRAFGLDPNTESQIRGSLGAGLKSVGENYTKPGLAAFASSAGAGIEGGKKADEKTTEQQDKYLQRAIEAKKSGDTASYNVNYLKYLTKSAEDKLAAEKDKAATGKGSVVNSPEQLYLRAIGATNQDAGIKISANTVREAQKQYGVDSKEAKAAMDAHEKRIKEVRDGHLSQLGVDPKKVGQIENKPGFSDKNPVKDFPKDPAKAQSTFDALPEGAYFINPKDGKLLIKRGGGSASATNPAQVAGAPGAPQAPAAPALATANAEDD